MTESDANDSARARDTTLAEVLEYSEEDLRRDLIAAGADYRIAAPGPGDGDPESVRRAYLGLLKLSLCDLVGVRTMSVAREGDSRARSSRPYVRELPPEELPLRVQGGDWPLGALTMVGLKRLDDLQECVENVVSDGVDGDLIEAGAWRGGASMLMRATLDSLGARDREVWVADSFAGLPAPDSAFPEDRALDLSAQAFLSVPLEDVTANFAKLGLDEGVTFVHGFFEETLPGLAGNRWAVARLDGDTYESTWLSLSSLYPGMQEGGFLILDDYVLIPECRAATEDFRTAHGITEPIVEIDKHGARWRVERPIERPEALPAEGDRRPTTPGVRRSGAAAANREPVPPRVDAVHPYARAKRALRSLVRRVGIGG